MSVLHRYLIPFWMTALLCAGMVHAESFQRYKTYNIGVLAYQGKDKAIKRWKSHVDYLNRQLAPVKFNIVPLSYRNDELTNAVMMHQVDFVITNPGHYMEMELEDMVSRIATRRIAGPEGVLDQFGGLAVTLAERRDLQRYADLAGSRVLIPSKSSLGGWYVHLREGILQGVDLRSEAEVIEVKNHREVINGILSGQGDAGFVRSDLLEEMIDKGEIEQDQLKVMNEQIHENYPYFVSTNLYPEWPFAMVKGTPVELASLVLQALLAMPADDPAAVDAHIHGWTIPANYAAIDELFKIAEIGPYVREPISLMGVIETYTLEIILLVIVFSQILLYGSYRLAKSNRSLENEIKIRIEAEHERNQVMEAMQDRVNELECIYGINEVIRVTDHIEDVISEVLQIIPKGMKKSHKVSVRIILDDVIHSLEEFLPTEWKFVGNIKTHQQQRGQIEIYYDEPCALSEQEKANFRAENQQLLDNIASSLSEVIELKEAEQKLSFMALHDSLTGLFNRRELESRIQDNIHRANRYKQPFSIFMLDLDHFKKINDNYDHHTGDLVLKHIAALLENNLRKTDVVARYGGEEFTVILPMTDITQATCLAKRLLETIESTPVHINDDLHINITSSMGVAEYQQGDDGLDDLLKQADQALYAAKENGRNQVKISEQSFKEIECS